MTMAEIKIAAPMIITSRLMPGIKIGTGSVSVELGGADVTGKLIASYAIDFKGEGSARPLEYLGNDLRIAVIAGDTDAQLYRKAAKTLISHLGAEAERWAAGNGEQPDDGWSFNAAVAEWAFTYATEIETLACEFDSVDD
jgi:hypothetical protein